MLWYPKKEQENAASAIPHRLERGGNGKKTKSCETDLCRPIGTSPRVKRGVVNTFSKHISAGLLYPPLSSS
jgi:hypothetical protein